MEMEVDSIGWPPPLSAQQPAWYGLHEKSFDGTDFSLLSLYLHVYLKSHKNAAPIGFMIWFESFGDDIITNSKVDRVDLFEGK